MSQAVGFSLGILCAVSLSGCGSEGSVAVPDNPGTSTTPSTLPPLAPQAPQTTNSQTTTPQTPQTPQPPQSTVPQLGSTHQGWKKTSCEQCHEVPQPQHRDTGYTDCAVCHGSNGACNPNAKQPHQQDSDCISCHKRKHSISKNINCVYCHLANNTTVTCP